MRKLACTLCCLMLVGSACFGQNTRYLDAMNTALAREDTASTFASVLESAQTLKRISETYPGQWEALYWTAHVYSQAGLFAGSQDERYKTYLDSAQTYYDRGWEAKVDKTSEDEAEFYVLQANIYALRAAYHSARQQWQDASAYGALEAEYMLRTAMTNPNNPRLHMRRGISLMRHEATRPQGRTVLQEAIQAYEQHPPSTTIAPSWGRNWIDFWLARYDSEPAGQAAAPSPNGERMVQTAHFDIHWNTNDATDDEVEQAQRAAEQGYALLQAYLGEALTPTKRLVLRLAGEGLSDETQPKAPYVDGQGTIYLYRFGGRYFGELVHELVHAFRIHTKHWSGSGFLEEGFAEFVAATQQPENVGFPRYGYPLDLVAGQWLSHNEAIPLPTLWQQHRSLNLKCKWQTYPLRASFFSYLHDTFGKAALLDLAYGARPMTLARFETLFGRSFDQLAKDWEADLHRRFAALDDAATQAKSYREQTPLRYAVQYDGICHAEKDF